MNLEQIQNIEKKVYKYVQWLSNRLRGHHVTLPETLDVAWKTVLDSGTTNELLRKSILGTAPFMASRFGSSEYLAAMSYLEIKANRNRNVFSKVLKVWEGEAVHWNPEVKEIMSRNAGFFSPKDKLLDRFSEQILQDAGSIDLLGVWGDLKGESTFYSNYCAKAKLTHLPNLEPYYHSEPWSLALEGKKVLVIHPFEESIQNNYTNRDQLFPFPVLPSFELKTVKAVQSIAGSNSNFDNWFDALGSMRSQIDTFDFDVALIGAGAYGMVLAAHVKRLGKKAIHLGGATQILFGIKGKRWDGYEPIAKFYNEYWTRPLPSEVPTGHTKIENGCYW